MDRRKFVVGGGAAAVATTLTAVSGAATPAVAASTIGTGPTSTADHVQRVLNEVNPELGLVDPAGLQRQFERSYAEFLASAPRDPNANDLDAWIRQRMVEVCGTDSYVAAVTQVPQARLLLAFSFLAYSQHQETPFPTLSQGMRVPIVLRVLEPDFLTVLLQQLNERCSTSREFASALLATSAELDRIFAEKLRASSSYRGRAPSMADNAADTAGYIAGVFVILGFLYWIKNGLKTD
jgi:hypothetical protein